MRFVTDINQQRIQDENISYYNEIAGRYDEVLLEDDTNRPVRQKVKEKLLGLLDTGWVLDFGGGTGLDLHWMANRYRIVFCEPSVAMREKAIAYNQQTLHNPQILFLDGDKTDFHTWEKALPFPQKMDAVLSNFGPVNCIPDVGSLFSRLSLVLKPGGHCLLLLLDLHFKQRLKWHRRNALLSLLTGRPFVMHLHEGTQRQTVYLHTPADIRKVSAPYFHYKSHEYFGGFGFTMFHLVRK